MEFSEWSTAVTTRFNDWFEAVLSDGTLDRSKIRFTFPSHIRMAETPSHFIAELYGEAEAPTRLVGPAQPERFRSTSAYFTPGPFVDDTDGFGVGGNVNTYLGGFFVARDFDRKMLERKFAYPVSGVRFGSIGRGDADRPILFGKQDSGLLLRQIDIVRSDGVRVWFRTVASALIMAKSEPAWRVRDCLDVVLPDALCVNPGGIDVFGRQLASLADQDLLESTLDSFLAASRRVFANALGYADAIPQPRLPWIVRHDRDPDESIPDYLMVRENGTVDILDLKRSVLRSGGVTGMPSRPRFNQYIQDLIAQLVVYRRYFDVPEHREHVRDKWKIDVSHPAIIGIVGNIDDLPADDVEQAIRNHPDGLTLMNYHDLVSLHRRRLRP